MKFKKVFAIVFSAVIAVTSISCVISMLVNKGDFSETFFLRQGLVSLKAGFFDLFGVDEYDGVYNAGDSLVNVCDGINDIVTLENIEVVKKISETTNRPVYFSLVPTAEYIYRTNLNRRPLVWEQGKYIEDVYYRLVENVAVVDVAETLYNYADDDIYFKTSDRLSPLGGYYVFQTMMKRLDYQVMEIQKYDVEYHDDAYTGELSERYKNNSITDRIEFYRYPFYTRDLTVKVTDKNGVSSAYSDVYLNSQTGFNAYLCGENPVTVIYNTETFSERLLVISDWTFNVNAGFFVDYFQEITFINPFLCENSFEKIKMDNYDYVIVMFSADNFNNHSLSSVNGMLE